MDPQPVTVYYICGDCGKENVLKQPGTDTRCSLCGFHILYKKRTRRIIEYQAR